MVFQLQKTWQALGWRNWKKHVKNTVSTKSGQSIVVSCLKMEMISQVHIMVNWHKHYEKRSCSFVCVICAVSCFYSNFILG